MNVSLHPEYFVSLLSAVVALVLFIAHREKTLSPRLLSVYFFCVSYIVFIHALVRYGDFIHFPHLWRTPVFVGMLNPALAFIYVRSVLEQRYWFRKSDILLISLSVLLALTFWEFYLQPAEVKKKAIEASLANRAFYLDENEGMLPPGFSLMIRNLFGTGMAIGQAVLLYRWNKHTRPLLPDNPQNLSIFRWLVFLTGAIGLTFTLNTIQHFFQFFHAQDFYWIISTTVMTTVLSALIYLLLRPNILYGLHGWAKPAPTEERSKLLSEELKPSLKRASISNALGEEIKNKLEAFLMDHKPYLKHGYTIANMATDINVPLYQLSVFINQQYGQSFNEFINGYRIQYIKDVLLKEPGADQYTLEAIGRKAGFNSRSTFIGAVKKKTGKTPSAFLNSRNSNV
jgi:AraC-like DNA-binding protein